jgi:hypothetical protein
MSTRRLARNRDLVLGVLMVSAALSAFCQQGGTPASQPAQTEPAAAVKAKQPAAVVELRDPFLPVGLSQQVITPDENSANTNQIIVPSKPTDVKWPKLNVTAKMKLHGKNVALLADGIGVVEEGYIIPIKRDGVLYRWRVDTITEKDVVFTRLDARPINAALTSNPPYLPPAPAQPTEEGQPQKIGE